MHIGVCHVVLFYFSLASKKKFFYIFYTAFIMLSVLYN